MGNAGIWIDHEKAVLVILDPAGERTETISAGHSEGGSGAVQSYTRNDTTAEDRLERKEAHHFNRFYDRVIESITGCKSVLVFGPSEAKLEFTKRLEKLNRQGLKIETEAADRMTEHQIVAHVKKKFLSATKS